MAKATFIGAASAAVTYGIGSAAGTITNFYVRAAVSAVAHGTFQGGMTAISGGKFWSGFASGALSSIAASAFGQGFNHEGIDANGDMINATKVWGGAGKFASSGAGMIAFGTVSGGAGAILTKGNFWQGAVTGLVVSGLNHFAHKINIQNEPPNRYKRYFAQKLKESEEFGNSVKKVYNSNKKIFRTHFDAAEVTGGTAEIIGFLGAPFTEGASLKISAQGAKMSAYGTIGNTIMDVFDGEFTHAANRWTEFVLSAGMGKAIDSGIPQSTLNNLLHAFQSYVQTYVQPVFEDSWNKFNAPSNKLKL